MSSDTQLIVVGGGPAALEAARYGAESGLSVTMVTALPTGGRATFGSLLPSKVWLHTAEEQAGAGIDAAAVTERIRTAQQTWSADSEALLKRLGVRVERGNARLQAPGSIIVDNEGEKHELHGEYVLIATGSEPIFSDGLRPDGEHIIAPRHTQKLTELPRSLTMVGGGVTGCEYALAFRRLGADVRIVTDLDRLLPRTDPELSERLGTHFESLGIELFTKTAVKSVRSSGQAAVVETSDGRLLEAEYAFIAIGRGPDAELLSEAQQSPQRDGKGWIITNGHGQSSIPTIYAAGDVTGPPLTANKAHYEARRAVAHIAAQIDAAGGSTAGGGAGHVRADAPLPPPAALIEAVYTQPQVAHIGPVSELAARSDVAVQRTEFAEILLPRIHDNTTGLLKTWSEKGGDRILGAAAFGENAAELLSSVQLAMEHGITRAELARTPFGHPTFSEIVTR